MTADTYADLRAAAEAATPGPWTAEQGSSGGWWVEAPNTATIADIDCDYSGHPEADAAFIAAANPARVLDLLNENDRLRAAVARVEAWRDDVLDRWLARDLTAVLGQDRDGSDHG